jgi:osmotically-inducible protein OsmY
MKTDEKLKEALMAQLNFAVGCSATNIQITVNGGTVTLRGRVPNYAEKMGCIETAQRVGGVTTVRDEVVVELPETRRCTDSEITAAALDTIKWVTTVPIDSIKITARAGRLTLEGTVEDESQKKVVGTVIRHLPGITNIFNLITTKSQSLQPAGRSGRIGGTIPELTGLIKV